MNREKKNKYDLHVVIASGPEDLSRAVLGFAFAASAAVSDINVLTMLSGDGAVWISDDAPRIREPRFAFSSIEEYIDILVQHNSDICLCSACAEHSCAADKINPKILPRLCHSGLSELTIRTATDGVQTVVF
ncbi:MAG: hypothetical protein GWP14_09055 [Actinobacteria bacterium]|nr:hypothetical protein [Actinomycetota bacterium]